MTSGTRSAAAVMVVLLVAVGSAISGRARQGGPPGGRPQLPTSAATFPLVGLQFTGNGGKVGAAFSIVRRRSAPNAAVNEIVMTIVPQYDPTRVRFRDAWFVVTKIDPKGNKKEAKLDFSSRMIAYPPGPYAPGDGPVSARVNLKPEEFVPLADADLVAGNLVNVGFNFRPEQIKAVRAFAQRVGLVGR
jgi:hypothetical protein